MIRKYSKSLSAITIVVAWGFFILSTLAMTPKQEASTATPMSSITATGAVTLTPTATPTFTPLPSATSTQTPTEGIPQPLRTELAAINNKLDNLRPTSSSKTNDAIESFVINLVSGAFWDFAKWLFVVTGLAAAISKFINGQSASAGRTPNRVLLNLETLFTDAFKVFLWLAIGIVFIWSIYYLGQSIRQPSNQSDLSVLSTQIGEINSKIDALPTTIPFTPQSTSFPTATYAYNAYSTWAAPSPTPDMQVEVQKSTAISLGFIALFVFLFLGTASLVANNQIMKFERINSEVDWRALGRKLLPAILLAFILLLSTSPIEEFLLVILIPFFLYSLFDILALYPNSQFQKIATKHYSKIIFWSVFGAWLNLFETLNYYLWPLWDFYSGYIQRTIVAAYFVNEKNIGFFSSPIFKEFYPNMLEQLPYICWSIFPFLLAAWYAWLSTGRIKKFIKEKHIDKAK